MKVNPALTQLDATTIALSEQIRALTLVGSECLDALRSNDQLDKNRFTLVSVTLRLELARDLIAGLLACIKERRMAPTQVLLRSAWEALLNASYHVGRSEAEHEGTVRAHERKTRERLAGLTPTKRDWAPDQNLHVSTRLADIEKRNPDLAATFQAAHQLYYEDSSGVVHGDLQGALSSTVIEHLSSKDADFRDAAYEPLVLWLSILIHSVVTDVAHQYGCPKGEAVRASSSCGNLITSLVKPIDEDSL